MVKLKSLITRAQGGDLDAYGEIVRRFQDMAYGYAFSILGDFHLAEDAAQEAFIRAYRDLHKLRQPEAFPGWLRRIVFKYCDRIKRRQEITEVSLEAVSPVASTALGPAEQAEKTEMRGKVLDAIRSLPDHERTATTLFYIDGYSVNEIAEFLGVPTGTVKRHLHDSRKRLKERMIAMVDETLKSHGLPADFSRETVDKAVEQAKGLIRDKKLADAEQLLRKALETAPNHTGALRQLNRAVMWGRVYTETGSFDLLGELAERGYAILRSRPDDEKVYHHLSETLLAIPAMPEAIKLIEEWIEKKGSNVERLSKLAWAKGCVADYDVAESIWEELLAVAKEAAQDEVAEHVPLATEVLVDCFSAAGEAVRTERVVQPAWDLCRDRGAVRLKYDNCFHSWPEVFKQAGLKAEYKGAAKAWLDAIQSGPEDDTQAEGEALCARAWLEDAETLTSDWLDWVRGRIGAKDWKRLRKLTYAVMRVFLLPDRFKERQSLAEAMEGLLRDVAGKEAASIRSSISLQRFPVWHYIQTGDLQTAERLAREAVAEGHKCEVWWLNDIAVVRGEPSPSELMVEIAEKGPDGPDMYGGDAWYHVAREAAAAGKQDKAFDALRRACSYWRNPPLYELKIWEKDERWGVLREHAEFKRIIEEKRQRIGPIYGSLWYFPGW